MLGPKVLQTPHHRLQGRQELPRGHRNADFRPDRVARKRSQETRRARTAVQAVRLHADNQQIDFISRRATLSPAGMRFYRRIVVAINGHREAGLLKLDDAVLWSERTRDRPIPLIEAECLPVASVRGDEDSNRLLQRGCVRRKHLGE